ncbi:MAG: RAMP superfamily CRISPR-associated protein [Acidobacteriota bacterium]
MSFDYYASLAENKACPKRVNEAGLASGFGDGCLVWSCRDGEENNARQCYMKRVAELELNLPPDLHLEPDHAFLPDSTWFGIDVSFTLDSPWYSKDDRPFHVLDNPVRKDRVFGVPFLSAASWKGLLRWACRMQVGLSDHLRKHDMKMDGWKDPSWIVHLFGNEKGEQKNFRSGALVFYPTWFGKVSFEVINPHSRSRRAGTQPICYEVVPAGTKGRLRLLYAPLPGEIENDRVTPADFIDCFIDSVKALLETYGVSAKHTAGWGAARIDYEESTLSFLEGGWMETFIGEGAGSGQEEPLREEFKRLLDEGGNPISLLLDENGKFLSKTQFKKIEGEKPCTNREFDEFKEWWEKYGGDYKRRLRTNAETAPSLHTRVFPFQMLLDALKTRAIARKGGDQ